MLVDSDLFLSLSLSLSLSLFLSRPVVCQTRRKIVTGLEEVNESRCLHYHILMVFLEHIFLWHCCSRSLSVRYDVIHQAYWFVMNVSGPSRSPDWGKSWASPRNDVIESNGHQNCLLTVLNRCQKFDVTLMLFKRTCLAARGAFCC